LPLDDGDKAAARVVERAVSRVARRTCLEHVLRATAGAAAAAAVVRSILKAAGLRMSVIDVLVLLIAVIAALGWLRRRTSAWTQQAAADRLERAYPVSRNVIFTARELVAHPDRAKPLVRLRVLNEAASILRAADPADVVPLAKPISMFSTTLVVLAAALVMNAPQRVVLTSRQEATVQDASRTPPRNVDVLATISPPAYTRLPERKLTNPDRIDLIEGSRLRLVITGIDDKAWRIRYSTTALPATRTASGLSAEVTVAESGYLAMEPAASIGERRLIPVTVTPDRAPVIQIHRPGKDLLVPDEKASVQVAAAATDDLGLQSLELKYTKVSGTGEQFEFVEGTLPLDQVRDSDLAWKGSAALSLARLGLEPGDSLVYRVVARDRRPGDAGLAASDTFFVEVARPGEVALAGFELPPDKDRYALSQQMIVLKIQRLRARERSLPRETVEREARAIGAEQRAVRANFIFLMGGQVEDEEEEAEQSHEIQEGRLANSARREIVLAIKYMSHAEQELAAVDTVAALPSARAAADALQRAFGRNRYILRTLAVRSRIDPARRLSGDLAEAGNWRRDVQLATIDLETREARAILAGLLELTSANNPDAGRQSIQSIAALSEEALAVNPASAEWQAISKRLARVRDALSGKRSGPDLRQVVQEAATPLLSLARKASIAADTPATTGALRSAWADEVRRR
jgi:hypothetical protein